MKTYNLLVGKNDPVYNRQEKNKTLEWLKLFRSGKGLGRSHNTKKFKIHFFKLILVPRHLFLAF
jgi:hypothetical protein